MNDIQTDDNGFIVKSDPLDVGVPMRPAPEGWSHSGPEDALDPNPTRGDYQGRIGDTRHVTTERHPKNRLDTDAPLEVIEQNANAENIVDAGGPLDAADPDYEAKRAARLGRR